MEPSTSTRFFFDSLEAATMALLTVLLDARTTDGFYRFGGLSAPQVLSSGLFLEGQITEVCEKLALIPGATQYDE